MTVERLISEIRYQDEDGGEGRIEIEEVRGLDNAARLQFVGSLFGGSFEMVVGMSQLQDIIADTYRHPHTCGEFYYSARLLKGE